MQTSKDMIERPGFPIAFIGHGTPLNALDDNAYTRGWAALAAKLARPRAILSISAHWYTRGTAVTAMERPRTIYDFGYKNLQHLTYPAPGDPILAEEVANLLAPIEVVRDHSWGLDHGTWTVLLKAYPEADIPVVQLSIDGTKSPQFHRELGRRLAPLRDKNILILATGNIVHNLEYFIRSPGGAPPFAWAERFDRLVRDKLTEREWDDMLRVNLKSVYAVIHYAAPRMIAQRSGRIIAVSSTSGQRGEAFHTHYSASKGAVISLTKGLSSELARHNILVNCVAPGWVDTDMSKPTLETKAGRKSVLAAIPLARVAKPDEIAGPILFAASDLATFVTGEVINVNGGAVLCG